MVNEFIMRIPCRLEMLELVGLRHNKTAFYDGLLARQSSNELVIALTYCAIIKLCFMMARSLGND